MKEAEPGEVTRLLVRAQSGDGDAAAAVLPLVYDALRAIAGKRMRAQSPAHTLQPTALVNEAYLRLVDQEAPWASRAHFLGVAARAMRSVLVDHARARRAAKRGGERQREPLTEALQWFESRSLDLLAMDEALERLDALDKRKRQIVELRFFAGLTNERTAEALDLSRATVEREWTLARAWLQRELSADETNP